MIEGLGKFLFIASSSFLLLIIGGHKRKTLDEVSILYKELSTRVFTQSAIKGTSSLVWSHAYYDTALWEELLEEHLGDKVLIKTMRDPNAPKVRSFYYIIEQKNEILRMKYMNHNTYKWII